MLRSTPKEVDLLVLGAGWTSQFLIPELKRQNVAYVATTTTGHDNTIPFRFDPDSDSTEPYKPLPKAKTVLITFPLKGPGQSKHITSLYRAVHGKENNWIQLGSTGIFNQLDKDWSTEDSPYDEDDVRAVAEDELRACVDGCVLNLCGLYGGQRTPRSWIPRLAKTKDDVRNRNSVHFVHGSDVAHAIVAAHRNFDAQCRGKRWIVTDLRVYDWWDLILSFSNMVDEEGEGMLKVVESEEEKAMRVQFARWVGELMLEEGVRGLPRGMERLGRKLDGRGFWEAMGTWPRHARLG